MRHLSEDSLRVMKRIMKNKSYYVPDSRLPNIDKRMQEQQSIMLLLSNPGAVDILYSQTSRGFTVHILGENRPILLLKQGWPEPVVFGTWNPTKPDNIPQYIWDAKTVEEKAMKAASDALYMAPSWYYDSWLLTYDPATWDKKWFAGGNTLIRTSLPMYRSQVRYAAIEQRTRLLR
jgi:hypothetical protein